ncbi:hypothetical protein ACQJBY_017454 [Aegilops geniculata]
MFVILDSAFDDKSDYHQHMLSILIPNFKRVWNMFGSSRNLNWRNWSTHFIDVPKQSNVVDCGIHTALYLKHWKPRVRMHDIIKDANIPNIRVRLANEMMFTDLNILSEQKDFVFDF